VAAAPLESVNPRTTVLPSGATSQVVSDCDSISIDAISRSLYSLKYSDIRRGRPVLVEIAGILATHRHIHSALERGPLFVLTNVCGPFARAESGQHRLQR
jgi:hypothetical protein